MKEVLAVLLLLTVVEGGFLWGNVHNEKWRRPFQPLTQLFQSPGQSSQPPGQSSQPPGQSFQPPGPPFPFPGLGLGLGRHHQNPHQQQQNSIDVSNAEWICQNPRTHDMMIIAAVDGAQTFINGQQLPDRTGPNSNANSKGQTDMNPNNENGNNMNPGTNTPSLNKPTPHTNTDEPSLQHAGKGLIDVRIGAN